MCCVAYRENPDYLILGAERGLVYILKVSSNEIVA
jgi:hypothetical protein